MRKPVVAVIIGAVAACAGWSTVTPITPRPTVIRSYEIGRIATAGVGDALFDVQSAVTVPEYEVIRDYEPGRNRWTRYPALRAGERLRAQGTISEDTVIVRAEGDFAVRLAVSPDGRVFGYDDSGRWTGGEWPSERLLRPVESLAGLEDSFRAQVIYSGMSGQSVRAVYREFAGDFIRPAFSQELEYSLAADSVIAYRSIRIRVIEANNREIRFQVLDDGDLQWMPTARLR